MRTQTEALEAAAIGPHREVVMKARFADLPCERPRFSFGELYTESHVDEPFAVCVATDGSIVRWRVESASSHHIYRQRITDPASASQWTTWTDSGDVVQALTEEVYLDLWCDPVSGNLFAAWIDGLFGIGVYWSYSTDHGATWAAKTLLKSWGTGNYIGGIAGSSYNGASYVFVAVNPMDAYDNSYVEMFYGSGTTLPAAAGTTAATRAEIRGIDCVRPGAGTITLLIADWIPCQISFLEYIPGSGWGDSGVVKASGVGSTLTYQFPRLAVVAVESGSSRYVWSYAEVSTAPAYSRAIVGFSPVASWLTEEVPWNAVNAYGLEVFVLAGYWYVLRSNGASRSAEFSWASGESYDVTETAIASLECVERVSEAGALRLVVDNSAGTFDTAGVSGAVLCIRPGAQLGMAVGYLTSEGRELVWRGPWWVTSVTHLRDGKRRVLVVEARDCLGELGALVVRRTVVLAAIALGTVLQRAIWRVAGTTLTNAGELTRVMGSYQLAAGETWLGVARRALRSAGYVARFRNASSNGVGWAAASCQTVRVGYGSSVWTVGGAGSQFDVASWGLVGRERYGVRVEGLGFLGEELDWAGIALDWRDTTVVVSDRKLDLQAEVDGRAEAERRPQDVARAAGVVKIGLVPGLEVGDVVTCTDALAGRSAVELWVRELRTKVDTAKGIVESELVLGGVVSWM